MFYHRLYNRRSSSLLHLLQSPSSIHHSSPPFSQSASTFLLNNRSSLCASTSPYHPSASQLPSTSPVTSTKMHFVIILASVALFLNLVAATPVAATTTPTTEASNLVRFKTRVHPGEDASKNGLYLSDYHIGKSHCHIHFLPGRLHTYADLIIPKVPVRVTPSSMEKTLRPRTRALSTMAHCSLISAMTSHGTCSWSSRPILVRKNTSMQFYCYADTVSLEWSSVRVTVGPPTEGFAIKDRKLVWNGYGFNGWLGEFAPLSWSRRQG